MKTRPWWKRRETTLVQWFNCNTVQAEYVIKEVVKLWNQVLLVLLAWFESHFTSWERHPYSPAQSLSYLQIEPSRNSHSTVRILPAIQIIIERNRTIEHIPHTLYP